MKLSNKNKRLNRNRLVKRRRYQKKENKYKCLIKNSKNWERILNSNSYFFSSKNNLILPTLQIIFFKNWRPSYSFDTNIINLIRVNWVFLYFLTFLTYNKLYFG